MKKKILICGATGFIGRNIAEFFATKDEFEVYGTHHTSVALNHPNIRMIQVDLTQPKEVHRIIQGMDIVIQAAATTSGAKDILNKPYYHVTDNAVMNSLIFRAAYDASVSHVIFFSCTVMYPHGSTPRKETDFDANQEIHSSYFGVGWTKVYIEKMCEFYSRLGRTQYTVLRHSNIYGPHDKFDLEKSHVFGATMTKVMQASHKITLWGSGEEERDLLYISDLVNFVDLALGKQREPFQLYNVGYGRSVSVKKLVEMMIACSGKKITIEHDLSKPTIPISLWLDSTKAKEHFGWVPQVSLEQGIQKTMEWYKDTFPCTN